MSGISIPGGLEFLFAHPEFQKFMKSERGREALSAVWAERPSASEHPFRLMLVTDIGVSGSFWISNGSSWSPISPITLSAQYENVSKTDADDSELIAFTTVIPGGLMGNNRTLEVRPTVTYPSSAATKDIKCYFGGFLAYSKSRTTTTLDAPVIEIINRNDATKQIMPYQGSANTGGPFNAAPATSSIDTTLDQTLSIGLKWPVAASGVNSITLATVRVRLIP